MNRPRRVVRTLALDFLLAATVVFTASNLLPQGLVACVHPASQSLILAVTAVVVADLLILPAESRVLMNRALITAALVCTMAAWVGSYRFSPLGFGQRGPAILGGFTIYRLGRPPLAIKSRDPVQIESGSVAQVQPVLLAGMRASCQWMSTNGGEMDDPRNCDIAYRAPSGVEYDVLKVLVASHCGLPNTRDEIVFSVLP